MTAQPDNGREPLTRRQVWVRCEPVGKVDLLGPSFGGDPYGLSLVIEVVARAAGWLWRLLNSARRNPPATQTSEGLHNQSLLVHENAAAQCDEGECHAEGADYCGHDVEHDEFEGVVLGVVRQRFEHRWQG